jgi:fatty-acyl-CoA synthase
LQTVVEALTRAAREASLGHIFVRADGSEHSLPFPRILEEADRIGRGLRALGLARGDRVALVTPDPQEFVLSFYGALAHGLVPVPLYPPASLTKLGAYGATLSHVLRVAEAKVLVRPGAVGALLDPLVAGTGVRSIEPGDIPRDLPAAPGEAPPSPDETALLQFTSGSTSAPKGVRITHGQLAANGKAIMIDGLRSGREDRGLSWLPLYHDMGLIGFVVAPLFTLVGVVFLPTTLFVRRPASWLQLASKHRATITFAPNFAFSLATKSIQERHMEGWDLSALRVTGSGAEPIAAGTLRAFADRFAPVGFNPRSFLPAYGMAEATLAVSFSPLGRDLVTDRIDPVALKEGEARPSRDPGALELVGCGRALPGYEVAVRDDAGHPVGERAVGELFVRGPSVASGYVGDEAATQVTFDGGWLRTGDLGYLAGGELYICGRKKDLIILHGRNYYPQDIESLVGAVDGVRDAQAAAFTSSAPGSVVEDRLVVVAETARGLDQHDGIRKGIATQVQEGLGLVVHEVVLIRRGTLPKTSSGKVRRAETRARLASGQLDLAGTTDPGDPREP